MVKVFTFVSSGFDSQHSACKSITQPKWFLNLTAYYVITYEVF